MADRPRRSRVELADAPASEPGQALGGTRPQVGCRPGALRRARADVGRGDRGHAAGFLEKIGFGFDRLRSCSPRIVVCSISGYGATGPYRDLPSHGVAYDAWSGVVHPSPTTTGSARIPPQANVGITAGPAFAAMAILAALVRARTTGEPASMEIAQSDAAAYFDWYRIETEQAYRRPDDEVTGNASDGGERRPAGLSGMWEGVRYQFYASADGYVLFMASEQVFWKRFCEGVGRARPVRAVARLAVRRPRPRQHRPPGRAARHLPRAHDRATGSRFASEHDTTIAPANTRLDDRPTTPSSRTGSRGSAPISSAASSCCSRSGSTVRSRPSQGARPTSASTPTRCWPSSGCKHQGVRRQPQRSALSGSTPRQSLPMSSWASSVLPGWKRPMRMSRNSCSSRLRLNAAAPPVRSSARSTIW